MSLGRSLAGTAVFLTISFTIGRQLVFWVIRWVNDRFVSELPVITAILVIGGLMALATNAIGVHTVLGAFIAGNTRVNLGVGPGSKVAIGNNNAGTGTGLALRGSVSASNRSSGTSTITVGGGPIEDATQKGGADPTISVRASENGEEPPDNRLSRFR